MILQAVYLSWKLSISTFFFLLEFGFLLFNYIHQNISQLQKEMVGQLENITLSTPGTLGLSISVNAANSE